MTQSTPDPHLELARQHFRNGQLADAERLCQQILSIHDQHVPALHLLGRIARKTGREDQAIVLLERARALAPEAAAIYADLGQALFARGRFDEAIAAYLHAAKIEPNFPPIHCNLGSAFLAAGQIDRAVESLRRALELKTDYPGALSNLGLALRHQSHIDAAIDCFRRAIQLQGDFAEAHNNLAGALLDLGQVDEALEEARSAARLRPDSPAIGGFVLFALQHRSNAADQSTLPDATAWHQRHTASIPRCPIAVNRSEREILKIGYVSADFCRHSVSYFFEPLLDSHDRRQFQIICYSNRLRRDDVTDRIRQKSTAWREIAALSDQQLIEQIRTDAIDILVDLSGHTVGNRLPAFAAKPAPIQVSYLGYPDTTGIPLIDYRLTDALADPPGMNDSHNAEKLMRLPVTAWCYRPHENAPEIEPRSAGPFTFGCFSTMSKINPPLVALWVEILRRVPESRLLLKSAGAGQPSAQHRLRDEFARHGITPDRVELLGRTEDSRGHLSLYSRIDIALDTYPYCGTTTTCEALWMGVPLITRAGQSHRSRVGTSLLTAVGLPDLIANDNEKYIQLAVHLSSAGPRDAVVRQSLREKMKSSPLMDATRFARDVEQAYRRMWQEAIIRLAL
jgi:predicted O-linked N-acetylglucosamine transferase (SPINDLY family)